MIYRWMTPCERMQGIRRDIDRNWRTFGQCPQHGRLEALREDLSVGLFGDRGRAGIPVVPKRSAATNADAATPTEPVKNGQPAAVCGAYRRTRIGRCDRGCRRQRLGARTIAYFGPRVETFLGRTRILQQTIMIQIERPKASNNGASQSSPGLDNGEVIGTTRKGSVADGTRNRAVRGPAARFLPGGGMSVGVALGWWVKRR